MQEAPVEQQARWNLPRIQEYLPETEDNANLPGVDPNLTQVQAAGAGIKSFGTNVTEQLGVIDKRAEQTENADAYSSVAQARSDFSQQLQQQTNDGTLNTGQFQQQYQQWVDDNSQNYNTPGARDYFQRQTARLGASLTRTASNGQVQIAYANGKASWQNALNNDVSTVTADPTQHDDVLASNLDNLDQMVKDGRVQEKDVPALQQQTQQQLTIGALRGTYRKNPDLAQQILDDGKATSSLNPQQQEQMYKEVSSAKEATITSVEQQARLLKAQQEMKANKFLQDNFQKMSDGNMQSQDIIKAVTNGTMSAQQGDMWLEKNRTLQGQVESNPVAVNQLRDKIFLPDNDANQIKDQYQLMSHVGHGVSAQDVQQMLPYLDKSPQGRAMNQNRKMLMDLAKSSLVSKNSFMGQSDPDGEYNLMKFNNALQQKEQEMGGSGQPISALYDPTSPQFFGKQIKAFSMTPMDKFNAQSQRMQSNQTNPTDVYAAPGAAPDMVNMTNPKGQKVRVLKSDYDKATKAGYK
jgi:hypothetical protein